MATEKISLLRAALVVGFGVTAKVRLVVPCVPISTNESQVEVIAS